jgi:hypothetical protein
VRERVGREQCSERTWAREWKRKRKRAKENGGCKFKPGKLQTIPRNSYLVAECVIMHESLFVGIDGASRVVSRVLVYPKGK